MDFPTQTEIVEIGLRKLVAENENITEAVARTSGTTANSLLQAAGSMAGEVMAKLVEAQMNSRIQSSSGDFLIELAWDWYGLRLKPASPAVVPLVLTQSGGKTGNVTAGTIVITNAAQEFRLLDSVAFDPSNLTATVDAQAVLTGPDGNVGPGSINQFKTPPSFDQDMTVTQSVWATGGDLAESEESLKQRCAAFWDAARRGIPGAIEFGAKTVPGIRYAEVTEETIYADGGLIPQYKIVKLFASDVNARLNDTLRGLVVAELENWRPAGVHVEINAGTVVYITIDISMSFLPGTDTVTAKSAAVATAFNYTNGLLYEQGFYRKALEDRLMKLNGVSKNPAPLVTVPTGDYIPMPGSGQVLKTREDLITINRRS